MTLELKLSLHPDRIYKRTEMEWDIIKKEIEHLPPIASGAISLDVVYTVVWEDKIEVGIYLRNATPEKLYFKPTPLLLLNSKGDVLANQEINLSAIGDIEPYSVRPWEIYFNKTALTPNTLDSKDLTITFALEESQVPFVFILEDKEPTPMTTEEIANVAKFIRTLEPVPSGEILVTPYEAELIGESELKVSIVLRHNLPHPAKLSRFQMVIKDAKGEIVAQAVFITEEYHIEPGMFVFRTFTYPKKTITAKHIDTTSWKVMFI